MKNMRILFSYFLVIFIIQTCAQAQSVNPQMNWWQDPPYNAPVQIDKIDLISTFIMEGDCRNAKEALKKMIQGVFSLSQEEKTRSLATALYLAINFENNKLVNLLLQAGASIYHTPFPDCDCNAVGIAFKQGNKRIINNIWVHAQDSNIQWDVFLGFSAMYEDIDFFELSYYVTASQLGVSISDSLIRNNHLRKQSIELIQVAVALKESILSETVFDIIEYASFEMLYKFSRFPGAENFFTDKPYPISSLIRYAPFADDNEPILEDLFFSIIPMTLAASNESLEFNKSQWYKLSNMFFFEDSYFLGLTVERATDNYIYENE